MFAAYELPDERRLWGWGAAVGGDPARSRGLEPLEQLGALSSSQARGDATSQGQGPPSPCQLPSLASKPLAELAWPWAQLTHL